MHQQIHQAGWKTGQETYLYFSDYFILWY